MADTTANQGKATCYSSLVEADHMSVVTKELHFLLSAMKR